MSNIYDMERSIDMHEDTNPRTALWFTTAGALTAMAVLAFPGVAAIERLLASAAAGGAVGDVINTTGATFGTAILALMAVVVLDVIVAWGLWGVFKPTQPAAAALSAALRITYSAVFAAAIGLLVDAQRLATGVGASGSLPVELRDELVVQRIAEFDSVWSAALIIFGAHMAVVAWLLLRHRRVFAGIVGVVVAIAAAGYLLDGAVPIVVPGWSGIAQFTFVGEILLIAWLVAGGIRSARLSRRTGSSVPAGPSDAATLVAA